MNTIRRLCLTLALSVVAITGNAGNGTSECVRKDIDAHVREQFAAYGPQSTDHEYFGFIYLHQGVIGSAVTRSGACPSAKCVVDTSKAAQLLPKRAIVLGEWHTHPHSGSPNLSKEDVLGAYGNRHISCYTAFYSTPSGEIFAWSPQRMSVPVAMASRAPLGNYQAEFLASR